MITELRIRDLATIADVSLQLAPGLNVLTGETGAGKSMLVDALGLLLGGRADPSAIRPGAARAIVEGTIERLSPALRRQCEALGVDADEGTLVIRREVAAEGRSRAWINGSPVAAGTVSQVGAGLVDLHSQHQTESLLSPTTQRFLLDAYADAEGAAAEVHAAFAALEALQAEEDELVARRDEATRKADYLRHVVQEIDAARLQPGEDERLEVETRRLGQAGALSEQVARLLDVLEDGETSARQALSDAARGLGRRACGSIPPLPNGETSSMPSRRTSTK